MSNQAYKPFYDQFDAQQLAARILQGDLTQGINVCVEICDKWASDPDRIALNYQGVERPP